MAVRTTSAQSDLLRDVKYIFPHPHERVYFALAAIAAVSYNKNPKSANHSYKSNCTHPNPSFPIPFMSTKQSKKGPLTK
jgi:hypothetical protein